jgi:hypothetical protein
MPHDAELSHARVGAQALKAKKSVNSETAISPLADCSGRLAGDVRIRRSGISPQ